MIEKEPKFFKYFDYSTGKMKKDAPQSAKDAYKEWQGENKMAVKKPSQKKGSKRATRK